MRHETRGRPPLPPEERRSVRMVVKLTEDEREELERAAAARGQPLTVYVRSRALISARRGQAMR